MTKKHRFYKDEYGWFIDLKWFPFNRAHLAMVCGADKLLDTLSEGRDEVRLKISTSRFGMKMPNRLERRIKLGLLSGATYEVVSPEIAFETSYLDKNHLWLCAVTLLVFGYYPKNIYYEVVCYE
jgi:hypothetical protein